MTEEYNTPNVKIEFKLPEDMNELKMMLNGLDWALIVWDIVQEVRHIHRYEETDEKTSDMVERIYDRIYDIIDEHGMNLDDIK